MQPFLPPQPSPILPPGPPAGMLPSALPSGLLPPGPADGVGGPSLGDPVALVAALRDLAGSQPQPALLPARYPPGFTPPKKPDQATIMADANRLVSQNRLWREMIHVILRWTRQELSGAFDEDIEEREQGFQDRFISTALSDERNLAIAMGSMFKIAYRKRATKDLKGRAEQLEQACAHVRREFEYRWVRDGNRPLGIDEWSMIVDYGMLCVRLGWDDRDPEFPLCRHLIDPTQVYPIWGGKTGLKAVYRVYRSTILSLMESYGDDYLDAPAMKKLKDMYGSDLGSTTEVKCYEYWDEWWRGVFVADVPVLPITAHAYGRCPWRIQYTGMGEAMFTHTPFGNSLSKVAWELQGTLSTSQSDRIYKAVPMLFYRIRNHDLFEAVMARVVTGIKKAINPPMIRSRSNMVAGTPMPALDTGPGQQNEIFRGEEDLSPIPTVDATNSTQLLLAALGDDKQTGGFPKSAYGAMAQASNVTGVAQQLGIESGMNKLDPLVKSFETGEAIEWETIFSLVRNNGEATKYGGDLALPPQGFVIPAQKRNADSFELDADLIDAVGSRIDVTYTQIDEATWLPLIQAGQLGIPLGVISREELRFKLVGEYDWEMFFQNWMDEQALVNATQLPEFAKAVTVPQAFNDAILAATGDPERQKLLQDQLAQWQQLTAPQPAPAAPGPSGPSIQPGPAPGAPPQGVPAGPPPPPPGSQVISTQGVSLPQLNQAPGNAGAPVGRPGLNVGP